MGKGAFDVLAASASLPDLPAPGQTQGPGIAVAKYDDAQVRMISDGAMALPFRALAPEAPTGPLLDLLGLKAEPEMARGDMSAALIDIAGERLLVDAGAGSDWQAGSGRLLRHMAANGIATDTVTCVVLTHLHPDHAWGVLDGDRPAFPNARIVTGRAEAGFWGKPGLADKVQPEFRPTVEGAARLLNALQDRMEYVVEGDEVVAGISVMDTPGHSPGHISLMLDRGDGLILTGDAVVNDRISFAYPNWPFGFDTDPDTARKSRRRLLEMAADKGHAMAGYHWSWPGIGHAERAGNAFRFVPD